MILGIGVDLVNVDRITDLLQKFDGKFEKKIFTALEIAKAEENSRKNNNDARAIFYAKRFAAKEAFSKACGLGIGRGINFCDIEVNNDNLGKPFIKLLNEKEDFLRQHFAVEKLSIHLSLSDELNMAKAMVVIEN